MPSFASTLMLVESGEFDVGWAPGALENALEFDERCALP
jgi:hypothetical protein